MTVNYSKQTLQNPNPIARFAHKKRHELSVERILKILGGKQTLLDYGCGKGDFLIEISERRDDVKLLGFDPESGHFSEKYIITQNMDEIEPASVDVFCSFETLEHLYQEEKEELYGQATRILKNSGTVVISVPVIGGPTLLLKELNHVFLHKRKSEYSLKELLLATFFGCSATRPENPRPTHKGFDFTVVEKELELNFSIQEKSYSPFPVLPWYLNSQVFYVCCTKQK